MKKAILYGLKLTLRILIAAVASTVAFTALYWED